MTTTTTAPLTAAPTHADGGDWLDRMLPTLLGHRTDLTDAGPDNDPHGAGGTAGSSHRDLRGRLATVLYERLHAGVTARNDSDLVAKDAAVDPDLEHRLTEAVPHRWCLMPGTYLGPATDSSDTVYADAPESRISMPEATVVVPTEWIVAPHGVPVEYRELRPGQAVHVRVASYRPRISPGYFYVRGSVPWYEGGVRRVFVHLTDQGTALDVWRSTLLFLERTGCAYHAKISSTADGFPRRDALVVYLAAAPGAARPDEVDESARALATLLQGRPGLGVDTSAFADQLVPGIAAADDPVDARPGYRGMSFGQHRAFLVASALMALPDAASPDAASPDAGSGPDLVRRALQDAFVAGNVDPRRPGRNLGSAATPPIPDSLGAAS